MRRGISPLSLVRLIPLAPLIELCACAQEYATTRGCAERFDRRPGAQTLLVDTPNENGIMRARAQILKVAACFPQFRRGPHERRVHSFAFIKTAKFALAPTLQEEQPNHY